MHYAKGSGGGHRGMFLSEDLSNKLVRSHYGHRLSGSEAPGLALGASRMRGVASAIALGAPGTDRGGGFTDMSLQTTSAVLAPR